MSVAPPCFVLSRPCNGRRTQPSPTAARDQSNEPDSPSGVRGDMPRLMPSRAPSSAHPVGFIEPRLPTPSRTVPDGPRWAFETISDLHGDLIGRGERLSGRQEALVRVILSGCRVAAECMCHDDGAKGRRSQRQNDLETAIRNFVDRFAAAVRGVFGRYVSTRKIEHLRLELVRAGIVARDEAQTPYKAGPPIAPLHS
jgi:hypothetical protein